MRSLLVSACLLGVPCRYDAASRPCPAVMALEKTYRLVPVCPEVLGGLPTPRPPCELQGEKVLTKDGRDCTKEYLSGAEKALEICRKEQCFAAVLKEKSPSCGKGLIHNGRFDGGLTAGDGICTKLLTENDIAVFGESETDQMKQL